MAFEKVKEAFKIVGYGLLLLILILVAAVGWLFIAF
jgi:hypothetical protein